jgi:L-asparaginase II
LVEPSVEPPVLAEVVRSGFVESRHRGHAAVVEPDGVVSLRLGDPEQPVFPRSTNKPLQTVAMVGLGLDVPPELLGIACASHAGLPMHVEAVRRLLASSGLTEADLDNTADLPRDAAAARALLAAGAGPDRLHQNCSGTTRRCWPPASHAAGRPPATATPRTRCRSRFARRTSE